MSKTSKAKDASGNEEKMSEMTNFSKNVKNAYNVYDLAKTTKNLTKPKEEVAGPEISSKCREMSTSSKVMGEH